MRLTMTMTSPKSRKHVPSRYDVSDVDFESIDGVLSTKIFSEKIDLTGSIITKMDGNSGGGAALSVKEISKKPIKLK